MKKYCILLLTMIVITYNSKAQDKIYSGFKLAPNFSLFSDETGDLKPTIGYGAGYFEVLELSNHINLQAELNYSLAKFSSDDKSSGKTITTTYSVNTLDLPIMIKYRTDGGLAFGVGYQLGLKSTTHKKVDSGTAESNPSDNKNAGFLLDLSYSTSNKNILGLRFLSPSNPQIKSFNSTNLSIYYGLKLF